MLGAAVHRDPDLAERLIREFLVEPKRCIAWSRGLDNVAVLCDAVAGFRRCQVRDAVLVLLATAVVVGMPFLALAWLAVAMLATSCGVGRDSGVAAASEDRQRSSRVAFKLAGGAVVTVFVLILLVMTVTAADSHDAVSFTDLVAAYGYSTALAVRAAIVALGLLAFDAVVSVHLAVNVFSRARFVPDPMSSPWRRLGHRRFRAALHRVRRAEVLHTNCADVVVSRGDSPFCGAGPPGRTRSFVMTLEAPDAQESASDAPLERLLHESITQGMKDLRDSVPLSPHHRLGALRHREQILIPAEELVRHAGDHELRTYLPQGFRGPPEREADVDDARRGIDEPHEWARYYQYFAVESWDRELVVSCYVTLGTDRTYLYLQWTPCYLVPLPKEMREELDDELGQWRVAARGFLTHVVTLPATVFTRLRRALCRFAPIRVPEDVASPEQFGARKSVREIAVGSIGGVRGQWFQRSDATRYTILFDRVMIESVRRCLRGQGFSLAEFDEVASTIINNFGDISRSTVAVGDGATATSTTSSN